MRFSHELSYDAPPEEVYAMLADPSFRERVSLAREIVSFDVTLTPTDTGFTLVNDQIQPTAGLPSFAKKFAGETTKAIQREEWSSHSSGTLRIETPGKPTSMQGTITLVGSDAGTVERVDLEIKAKVPLIGGKLESLMADQVREGMDIEHQVGQAWLRGER
jgi:carbon monoxide dehydrogenase subunit G